MMLNNEQRSLEAIEQEVEWLHDVLYHVEEIDNFCRAHEVLDLNRYKVITKLQQVRKVVVRRQERPFIFISNKN